MNQIWGKRAQMVDNEKRYNQVNLPEGVIGMVGDP